MINFNDLTLEDLHRIVEKRESTEIIGTAEEFGQIPLPEEGQLYNIIAISIPLHEEIIQSLMEQAINNPTPRNVWNYFIINVAKNDGVIGYRTNPNEEIIALVVFK